jgi:hypothetical protein
LQQATQQMQAQAAGAMVSQRGLNPALATRLIAQNQAAMSQQAAGQSAQLRLQEQLGAQGQLAQALSAQRGQDIQTLGTAGGLQQGQNALGLQNSQGTQAINAQVAAGNQNAQMQAQGIDAQTEAANAAGRNQVGSAIAGGVLSGGGAVLAQWANNQKPRDMAKGGEVRDYRDGGEVPGRAAVKGDSPRNDTVPAVLSPGEVVLPRTVAQAPDAPDRAAGFVEAIKRRGKSGPPAGG